MLKVIDMRKALFVGLVCGLTLVSCNKEPGTGGKATIKGTVMEYHYNSIDDPTPSYYPIANEDVYIIYGDGVTYNDRQRTGPNGEFEFNYLRKGNYTIYVYSDNPEWPTNPEIAVEQVVEITERKQEIEIPTIEIHDF